MRSLPTVVIVAYSISYAPAEAEARKTPSAARPSYAALGAALGAAPGEVPSRKRRFPTPRLLSGKYGMPCRRALFTAIAVIRFPNQNRAVRF
jgi:hypothetical protein